MGRDEEEEKRGDEEEEKRGDEEETAATANGGAMGRSGTRQQVRASRCFVRGGFG